MGTMALCGPLGVLKVIGIIAGGACGIIPEVTVEVEAKVFDVSSEWAYEQQVEIEVEVEVEGGRLEEVVGVRTNPCSVSRMRRGRANMLVLSE